MRLSSSALALAILGFAAALPTPPHANPAFDPPTPSNNSCPTLPDQVIETKPIDKPKPIVNVKPVGGTKPIVDIKPVGGTKPIVDIKQVDNSNPTTSKSLNTIRPTTTSQYDVWTGAVRYSSARGKIFKDGKTTDVSTLLTFDFPAESAGKTCSFHFDLLNDPSATLSGSGQFDVYISQAPATASSESWPSGNLRDHHIGRMAAKLGAEATWVPGHPVFGQSFPCPEGRYGGELVGYDSADHIEWVAGASGPYIAWE